MLWRVWSCFKYLLQYHRCPFPLQQWLYFNRHIKVVKPPEICSFWVTVKVKIWALGFTKAIMKLPVLKCRITLTNQQNYAFKCCNSNITFCKFTFFLKMKGCIICLIYMVFHSWPNVPFHSTWGLKWKLTARNYLYKMNSVKYVWFTQNENGHLMLFTVCANSTLLLFALNGHEWLLMQRCGPYAVHWLLKTPDHFTVRVSFRVPFHIAFMDWNEGSRESFFQTKKLFFSICFCAVAFIRG